MEAKASQRAHATDARALTEIITAWRIRGSIQMPGGSDSWSPAGARSNHWHHMSGQFLTGDCSDHPRTSRKKSRSASGGNNGCPPTKLDQFRGTMLPREAGQ
jgi:hypothetical protein